MARLAGLPEAVIRRSKEILADLESEAQASGAHARPVGASPPQMEAPESQLGLFQAARDPDEGAVLAILRESDPQRTTPLEALALLAELRERLTRGDGT